MNTQHGDTPVSTVVTTITPALAKQLLATNTKENRPIKTRAVHRYATIMAAGDWMVSQPILIDRSGRLIDGQHRLNAVVEARVNVPMLVIRGLDPEAFKVLDTGVKRSAGDVLSIHGAPSCNNLAATIKVVIGFNERCLQDNHKWAEISSNARILAEYTRQPARFDSAVAGSREFYNHVKLSVTAMAAAILVIPNAEAVLRAAHAGTQLENGSPEIALLRWVMSNPRGRTAPIDLSAIIRATEASTQGRSLHAIKPWRPGQQNGFPYPVA